MPDVPQSTDTDHCKGPVGGGVPRRPRIGLNTQTPRQKRGPAEARSIPSGIRTTEFLARTLSGQIRHDAGTMAEPVAEGCRSPPHTGGGW